MRIFFAPGCPFAQRSRALLTHLKQPFEEREIDLTNKPADFLALSPTGKVPLIEDDGFVLYESAVVNEYLSEQFGWRGFSQDVKERARERLAMVQFDSVVNPFFYKTLKTPDAPVSDAVLKELEQLEKTVKGKPVESLLGFHLATMWIRWNWIAPEAQMIARVRELPALRDFFERAAAMDAVKKTTPEREPTVAQMRKHFGLHAA